MGSTYTSWCSWMFSIAVALSLAPIQLAADSDGAALKISVDNLASEFRVNEIAAEKKYKSTMVLLTGRIDRIVKNSGGSGYFLVMRNVLCHFQGNKKSELEKLKQGEEVTVLGRCRGKDGDYIEVRSCEIVRLPPMATPAPNPNPAPNPAP